MRIPAAFAAIVVIAGLFLLFLPQDVKELGRSLAVLWDLGHVVFFFCLLSVVLPRFRWRGRQVSPPAGIVLALAIGLGLGGLIEALQQGITGREASLGDLYLDVTGALLAAGWIRWHRDSTMTSIAKGLRVVALLMILPVGAQLTLALMDEWRAWREFPVLLDSGDRLSLTRFGNRANLEPVVSGVQVAFSTAKYSGFNLRYFPRDWSDFARLELLFDNPAEEAVSLTCRIHDRAHNQDYADRFNGRYAIVPGANVIVVDLAAAALLTSGRRLDMRRIAGLGCFTTRLAHPAVLVLRRIRLVEK
ncbi:MAG TPA: VanZ family protein [Gammaproteobacteria bacterium]|nr:VanZ family protein [Gammaproteobacteria bacterium]